MYFLFIAEYYCTHIETFPIYIICCIAIFMNIFLIITQSVDPGVIPKIVKIKIYFVITYK